jgi:hypothetical protein
MARPRCSADGITQPLTDSARSVSRRARRESAAGLACRAGPLIGRESPVAPHFLNLPITARWPAPRPSLPAMDPLGGLGERMVRVNGVGLCGQAFGDPGDPVIRRRRRIAPFLAPSSPCSSPASTPRASATSSSVSTVTRCGSRPSPGCSPTPIRRSSWPETAPGRCSFTEMEVSRWD